MKKVEWLYKTKWPIEPKAKGSKRNETEERDSKINIEGVTQDQIEEILKNVSDEEMSKYNTKFSNLSAKEIAEKIIRDKIADQKKEEAEDQESKREDL